MLSQNISELQKQIREKELNMQRNKNHMNNTEADVNNGSTVPVDFIVPTHGVIGGIPGIGMSNDRLKYFSNLDNY